MDENCIKKNRKLLIGSFLLLLSGWLIGCGVGKVMNLRCEVTTIGIGLSILVVGVVFLKIYFMEKNYNYKRDLYKKD